LLWHTLSRLAKLLAQMTTGSVLGKRLELLAAAVHKATMEHFLCLEATPSFSYLVDGAGKRTFYHDANDLPTLLAPSWGFLRTGIEEQAWHTTMRFAFSTSNKGGYYAGGDFEGLGSVHTRNPWTLGYFQQWRYAQMTGNYKAETVAWRKICGVMLWDGMFSEAVDGHSGEVTSKAWFSWPGSMIASGLLQPGNRERYL
jgi:meiotically up-regulated gene 157 (Mug157) protein